MRRELGIAGAAAVDAAVIEVQGGDGINDKVGEVVFGNPFPDADGKQHGGLAVNVLESGSHGQPWRKARHRARKSLL